MTTTFDQLDVAIDRPLPQSPDAERAVLGSILINNNAFYRVVGMLGIDDFFNDAHRTIWQAMLNLSTGDEIDLLSLKDDLARHAQLEHVGGAAYIASLVDGIPDVAGVERYARMVRREAGKRRKVVLGHRIMQAGLDPIQEPEDIAAWALGELARESAVKHESKPMYDVVLEADTSKRERNAGERHIRTPFPILDGYAAFRRKAVTIVAAPTSHGKTTFMKNVAAGMLKSDPGIRVAFYSLEEDDEDMSNAMLAILSGALLRRVQNRTLTDTEQVNFRGALDLLQAWRERFFFADRIRDFESLHADCRRLKMRYGLDAIFVDYLQLMGGFDDLSGEREVNRIGRGLKRLAQDLDISVTAGSQVNKEREKRTNRRLSISDMKYGAVIGEHADVAMMFQRPRQDDKSNIEIEWCEMTFQMEKNRGRETGDVPMHADMPTQTIAEGTCTENRCRWRGGTPGNAQMRIGG